MAINMIKGKISELKAKILCTAKKLPGQSFPGQIISGYQDGSSIKSIQGSALGIEISPFLADVI